MWQNSRAVQREDPRAHLCCASLLTLKSLLWIKNIGEDWEGARIHLSTRSYQNYKTQTVVITLWAFAFLYTTISRKVVRKTVHATIPKGNMGYDQYTVPDIVAAQCQGWFSQATESKEHSKMKNRSLKWSYKRKNQYVSIRPPLVTPSLTISWKSESEN